LPSGRILAINKAGQVRLGNGGLAWATVSFFLLNLINSEVDRGLVGIDIDPDYATNGIVYLYTATRTGVRPGDHGRATTTCGRLSKLTVDNRYPDQASERAADPQLPAFSAYGIERPFHTVGTVLVMPDHTLFAGNGDSTLFDPAHGGGGNYDPTSSSPNGSTRRGQDLPRQPGRHRRGQQPLLPGRRPSSWQSRIYAYGGQPVPVLPEAGYSTPYIGDVGSGEYEETDVSHGGENFGWPCYEGPLDNATSSRSMTSHGHVRPGHGRDHRAARDVSPRCREARWVHRSEPSESATPSSAAPSTTAPPTAP
jgi:glucose/arabinose dehydrogenase